MLPAADSPAPHVSILFFLAGTPARARLLCRRPIAPRAKTLAPPQGKTAYIKPSTPSPFPLFQLFRSAARLSESPRRSPPSLRAGLPDSGDSSESSSLLLLLFCSSSSGAPVDVHVLFQFTENQASHSNPRLTCVGAIPAASLALIWMQSKKTFTLSRSPCRTEARRALVVAQKPPELAGERPPVRITGDLHRNPNLTR
jgi:hypothetical protein